MSQDALQDEVRYLEFKLSDNLFNVHGIELEELTRNTFMLKLHDDEEYKKIMEEYNQKIENLYKQ